MYIDRHQAILAEAMDLHREGHLQQAQQRYEAILSEEPSHFTALHMLGVIACQQQNYQEGIGRIKKALIINPRSLSAYVNLVNAFEQTGQYREAIINLYELLLLEPAHLEAHQKMASLLNQIGLDQAAIEYCNKSNDLSENYSMYLLKGTILLKKNCAQDALVNFKKAIELKPDCADAYANAGTASIIQHQQQQAVAYYNQALTLDPSNEAILKNRELALHFQVDHTSHFPDILNKPQQSVSLYIEQNEVLVSLRKYDEAVNHINMAVKQHPDHAELYHQQAVVWMAKKNYQAAVNALDSALIMNPHYKQAEAMLAYALMGLRKYEEAISLCKRLLEDEPNQLAGLNNMACSLVELNQREQALELFNRVIEIDPNADYAKLNACFCYLALEDYKNGLPLYEYRWQGDLLKSRYYIPRPRWLGNESLQGETIFLYGEQGFGDAFQFARYINHVAQRGCHILLGVNDSIKSLFKRSFPFVELTDKSKPLPHLDFHCPLGSLPLAFDTSVNTIPSKVPYLFPDRQRVNQWKNMLNDKKLHIGITWRGNPDNGMEIKRAIPLSLLIVLAEFNVKLVNLKIDIDDHEQSLLDQYDVIRADHHIHDFDDTAALIENLDLVISTDTSIAHLAGALGKPLWVLLPFSADWRWHLNRNDSAWYPTARLFRQPKLDDWASVVENVKFHLAQFLASQPQKF